MAQHNEEDLRQRLDETQDEQLLEQRRRLEEGEPQPSPQLVDEIVVLPENVTVVHGTPNTTPLRDELGRLVALDEDDQTRTMLVIRQRSITDNTFTVTIELTTDTGLGPDKDTVELAQLWFFDHTDRDHHHDDALIESDATLGLWFLDVGDQVARFAALNLPPEDIGLRLTVGPVHPDTSPKTPFTLGSVSIGVYTGVGDREVTD